MRKVYFDMSGADSCFSIFVREVEAVPAGTVIYSMSVKHKCEEYERIAEQFDIKFIFDDNVPEVKFYTVPRVDIFAVSSEGGFLGTTGGPVDIETEASVCYINSKKECFTVAGSLKELLVNPDWKVNMKRNQEVLIFDSLDEAKQNLEFIECRGQHEK